MTRLAGLPASAAAAAASARSCAGQPSLQCPAHWHLSPSGVHVPAHAAVPSVQLRRHRSRCLYPNPRRSPRLSLSLVVLERTTKLLQAGWERARWLRGSRRRYRRERYQLRDQLASLQTRQRGVLAVPLLRQLQRLHRLCRRQRPHQPRQDRRHFARAALSLLASQQKRREKQLQTSCCRCESRMISSAKHLREWQGLSMRHQQRQRRPAGSAQVGETLEQRQSRRQEALQQGLRLPPPLPRRVS